MHRNTRPRFQNPKHTPQKRESRSPMHSTSWEPLAQWYDGWVGKEGSLHHQKLALPAALELLQPKKGELILDVGCGQGVLAKHILEKQAEYLGVDASPTLIEFARKHNRNATFFVQDARTLRKQKLPQQPTAAVFLLSIQDMDPLHMVLDSVASVLSKNSRIIIVMTHPSFRVPRQSGWGYDEERKLTYRRVDSYLTELDVPMKAYSGGKQGVSKSYHRPLQSYVNQLGKLGFAVNALHEIPTYKKEQSPGPISKSKNRAYSEIPVFLALRAVRMQS